MSKNNYALTIVVAVLAMLQPSALAVFCGTESKGDHRFDAVCALQRRDAPPGFEYVPVGSGVLASWIDPLGAPRIGILSVRHFLDANGTPGGGCEIQQNVWYAYFRRCDVQPGPSPCANLCYGPDEDLIRVRIKCFTLAAGEFAGLTASADGVVVGEIEPADIPFLCNITPMTLLNPIELGCIMGHEALLAGWGEWANPGYCDGPLDPKGRLHIGTTAITTVGCATNGRKANIGYRSDFTACGPCMASGRDGDSGGALCVEMGDGSVRLIGITQTGSNAFMATAHHLITAAGSGFLCRPCYPVPTDCADMNGDGREDCADLDILLQFTPRLVVPLCPGDQNGDGCAGTPDDLKKVICDRTDPLTFRICAAFCRGDVNHDGFVDITDHDMIAGFLGANESLPCPCQTCTDPRSDCPWDADFDGDVDLIDLAYASGSYQCSPNAPGCGPNGQACE